MCLGLGLAASNTSLQDKQREADRKKAKLKAGSERVVSGVVVMVHVPQPFSNSYGLCGSLWLSGAEQCGNHRNYSLRD